VVVEALDRLRARETTDIDAADGDALGDRVLGVVGGHRQTGQREHDQQREDTREQSELHAAPARLPLGLLAADIGGGCALAGTAPGIGRRSGHDG
jgi:hypothetical protein